VSANVQSAACLEPTSPWSLARETASRTTARTRVVNCVSSIARRLVDDAGIAREGDRGDAREGARGSVDSSSSSSSEEGEGASRRE
jgi:hypothetical protein